MGTARAPHLSSAPRAHRAPPDTQLLARGSGRGSWALKERDSPVRAAPTTPGPLPASHQQRSRCQDGAGACSTSPSDGRTWFKYRLLPLLRGKTTMCNGGKPHPHGCGWEHTTGQPGGSCPADEPVPILQRGPCPAHHLCSTVIPKSRLRPAGFCPISSFLTIQVVSGLLCRRFCCGVPALLQALQSEPERLCSQLGEEQRRERFLGAELRAGSLPDGERFDSQICGGL